MQVRVLYIEGKEIKDFNITMEKQDEDYNVSYEVDSIKNPNSIILRNPFLHPHFPMMVVNMVMAYELRTVDMASIKIIGIEFPEKTHDFDQRGELVEVFSEKEKEIRAELGASI
jgi:hypothetical protein